MRSATRGMVFAAIVFSFAYRPGRAEDQQRFLVDNRFLVIGRRLKDAGEARRSFAKIETWFGVLRVPREYVRNLGPTHTGAPRIGVFDRTRVAHLGGVVRRVPGDSGPALPVKFHRVDSTRSPLVNAPGALVKAGDRLETGAQSAVLLDTPDAGMLRLDENGELLLFPDEGGGTRASCELRAGRAFFKLRARGAVSYRLLVGGYRVDFTRAAFFAERRDRDVALLVRDGAITVTSAGGAESRRIVRGWGFRDIREGGSGASGKQRLGPAEMNWMKTFAKFYSRQFRLPAAEMCYVPAGPFVRGALEDGPDGPAHRAWLDAFLIDAYETTRWDYQGFVDATGYRPADTFRAIPRLDPEERVPDTAYFPVEGLSWNDAAAFAAWVGRLLPTEAQWEKAARGTLGARFPWGDSPPEEDMGRFSMRAGFTRPAAVDAFPKGASPFSVYSMAGNVSEWCLDYYDPGFYREGWRTDMNSRRFKHRPVPPPTGPRGFSDDSRDYAVQNPVRDTPPKGQQPPLRAWRGGRYNTRTSDPVERRDLVATTRHGADPERGIRGIGMRTAVAAARVFARWEKDASNR